MTNRRPLTWLLLVALAAVTAVQVGATLVVDSLWFDTLGQRSIFRTMLVTQAALFAGGTLVVGSAIWAGGAVALQQSRNRPVLLSRAFRGSPLGAWLAQSGNLPHLLRQVAVVLGALSGIGLAASWRDALGWWHAVPFGTPDPLLGLDPAFYIWTLPMLQVVRRLLLGATTLSGMAALGVYMLRGSLSVSIPDEDGEPGPPRLRLDEGPRRHLAVVATLGLLLIAVGYHLDGYAIVHTGDDLFDGPGYTAVHVVLPLLTVQAIATAVVAWLVFQAIDRLSSAPLVGAIVVGGLAASARGLLPPAVQSLWVDPNEQATETPYIADHIAATRRAWGLSEVEERSLSGAASLTLDDIEANRPTVDSIRLWDHDMLLETFRQVQEIRTYYEFDRVDNDRYLIDGQLRQTMLSPRELLSRSLPDQARTWVNERLVYTHGYGVALGPVNTVTDDGLPFLWVKDLPPEVVHPDPLAIERPEIYFGELMPEPVFVRTGAKEFDFPTADGNAYSTYTGAAGVEVAGFVRRLVLALRLGDLNVLLSGEITAGSRVLLYRQVVQRVRRIAPFLWIDADPTMAIVDGRLVWIVEGMTHTARYPASAHRKLPSVGWANYVRNSVKVTVDAYDGTVTFYRIGDDPILDTWAAAFPEWLTPADEMPEGIRAHLRYPLDLFRVQTALFGTYHMTDPGVFYNREDEWEIPVVTDRRMTPYYTIMKLPGETSEEFILMLPFNPRDKDNLAAWMVARNDGEQYGGLRVYRFPKDRLVYGPSQVVARIRQNEDISEKLTLWNQQSSQAPLGTMLVIPIEESLVYILPLYLRSDNDAIPELKRVIVGYEDQIAMAPTLDAGLKMLFGGGPTVADRVEAATAAAAASGIETWQQAAAAARARYDEAMAASKAGDWAAFGTALEALGQALSALEGQDDATPAPVDDTP